MLSENQTALIWVTRCLIRIQAVCIWHHSCEWRAKD